MPAGRDGRAAALITGEAASRCIRPLVPSAASKPKYRSNPVVTGPFTAGSATANYLPIPQVATDKPLKSRRSERRIIHVDLDAFFASVEELLDPSLEGRPVIVCYHEGIVATASYAARKYGVVSQMPAELASQLCPAGIFLPVRKEAYLEYSERFMLLLKEHGTIMEQASIDEAFLDVTGAAGSLRKAQDIGRAIQQRVAREIGLPCSIGIASNKLVSKIACNFGKPNGFVVVLPGEAKSFLAPLPVDQLPGVGASTKSRLEPMAVHTIGELARMSRDRLLAEFGQRGIILHEHSQGIDDSPVRPTKLRLTAERRLR